MYETCPTFIFGTSRVTMRSTSRVASLPLTRYLNSGETSMRAAALRIALYSRSWWTSYELTAKYPAQSRQLMLSQRADVRGWKQVPMGMGE